MHPRTPCQRFTRGFIAICMTAATLVLGIQPALAQTHPVANNHASQFQLTLETIPARVENGRLILGSANLGLTFPQVTRPLSIAAQLADRPQLLASTYLGGSTWDSAYAVAVDSAGAVFVAGETPASDFPTVGGFGNVEANQLDAFLVKIAPDGVTVEYAVLIGGGSLDSVFALAVENGIAYIAGETWSRTFPAGVVPAGENDVWAAAVTPDGSGLIYAVRLGGSDQDRANGLTVEDGRVTLTGVTWSPDFPAPDFHGGADVFVTQLSPTGEVVNTVLLGGSDVDAGFAIDANGSHILICGQTWSRNFPIRGLRGEDDGFVMLLDANLTLTGGAVIGGSAEDSVNDCGFSVDGTILAAGRTASTDMDVAGNSLQGEEDAFVARFDASGSVEEVLQFGGSEVDGAQSLAIAGDKTVWVAGTTSSTDFPTTVGAIQPALGGEADAYIVGFNGDNLSAGVQYASLLGGSANDYAQSLAVSPNGLLVMAGFTQSNNFPLESQSLYSNLNGSQDAFIAWLGDPGSIQIQPTATLQPPVPTGTPVPTLSEEEISAAETARPTLPPPESATEVEPTNETAISPENPTSEPLSPTPKLTSGGIPSPNEVLETSTPRNSDTERSPLVGWGLGFLAVGGIAVGIFVFLNRRKTLR